MRWGVVLRVSSGDTRRASCYQGGRWCIVDCRSARDSSLELRSLTGRVVEELGSLNGGSGVRLVGDIASSSAKGSISSSCDSDRLPSDRVSSEMGEPSMRGDSGILATSSFSGDSGIHVR